MKEVDRKRRLDLLCGEYDHVMRIIRIAGVQEDDVEDLAEDVMVAAVKSIHTLKGEAAMRAWIRTIAANKICRYFTKKSRRREILGTLRTETGEELSVCDLLVDEGPVEEMLRRAEEKELVETLLDMLPENNRRILLLRFWGDYTFPEIARMLNMKESTVKTNYRRSLALLKKNYLSIMGKEEGHG